MKTVVICGSKKYKDEIEVFCKGLEALKVVAFPPNFEEPVLETDFFKSEHITKTVFKGLTLEHFDWIRKADVCFIFNKDNYVGISVSMEIGYASALGKPVYALNAKTGDPCRDALIDKIAKTPQDLVKLLY